MRGFASYVLAGVLIVLALDFMAPPAGLGIALGGWPSVGETPVPQSTTVSQTVIRTHKTDRLSITPLVAKPAAPLHPAVLVGCDPAFSPLSVSAQANFSGRCIA